MVQRCNVAADLQESCFNKHPDFRGCHSAELLCSRTPVACSLGFNEAQACGLCKMKYQQLSESLLYYYYYTLYDSDTVLYYIYCTHTDTQRKTETPYHGHRSARLRGQGDALQSQLAKAHRSGAVGGALDVLGCFVVCCVILDYLGAAPVRAAPAAVSRQRIRGALNLGTSQVRKCRRYVPKNHKSESGRARALLGFLEEKARIYGFF